MVLIKWVIDLVVLRLLMIASLILVFFAVQCHYRFFGLNKVAVLCSGSLAPQVAMAEGIYRDSLAGVQVTIDNITLKQENGTSISFMLWPAQVHVPSTEDVADLIANYFAEIPDGVYVGGTVVISSARAEFENDPGVLVPVSLPQGGELPVDVQFEVSTGVRGVLKLELDNMKILQLEDSSLALDAELHLEADIGRNGIFRLIFEAGNVRTDGVIFSRWSNTKEFDMAIADGVAKMSYVHGNYLVVDYGKASILLPPAVEGGEPIEGTPADLADNASVHVTGALDVGGYDFMVLTADTVQILEYDFQP